VARLVPGSFRARFIILVTLVAGMVAAPTLIAHYALGAAGPDGLDPHGVLHLQAPLTLAAAALAIGLAAWLAVRITRPLAQLRDAARDLAGGKLERRVAVEGTTEQRALAGAFNEMAARLEQLVKARYRSEGELRRARNEAVEATQLKSRFLATMSHEIRTPMNGVIGMVALLRESELDEEQREFAETIHASAQQLLSVIDDILDFSKGEAGKLRLAAEPFELRTTLETVVDLVAPGAQRRGLEVVCALAPDLPETVVGDAGRLRQILANLVGNAAKFTEQGEIMVRAELEGRGAETASVRISVHDTGIGIPLAAQKHLFQPFVQADDSTSRRFGGTGLGIAIAKQLVEAMHGRIRCDSTPGVGTVFSFTVELGCTEPVPPRAQTRDLGPAALVVETNAPARECLVEQLAGLGVSSVALGSAARLPLDVPPALVFLDPRALDEVSPAGLARLRAQGPLVGVPVVLVAPMLERAGLEPLLGPDVTFLKKPIRHSALVRVLRARDGATPLPRPEGSPEATPGLARLTPRPDPRRSPGPAAPPAAVRVLVAEDNPVNQRVAIHMLARLGIVPKVVPNGREAVQEVLRGAYDVVLMDVQMPELDGYAATAEIRKLEPQVGRVAIYAMTANALEGDREFCLQAGMDDYIAKPITLPGLRRLLARWIEHAA
jgi:signal transduction histidine kinase